VKIGNNTTIAAGSTITKDVPSDALGVGRAKQLNKDNWSKKKG
jgi:bifunctional UDP-N-acetylglucosamine pyrophosphorylase/glucosamine-1-phosphate N-acetyltransferase